jgi:hypothetical protein
MTNSYALLLIYHMGQRYITIAVHALARSADKQGVSDEACDVYSVGFQL